MLIIHGDKDSTVHLDQSQRMVDEYRKHDRDVTLEIVPGAGHGGTAHFSPKYREKVTDFLREHVVRTDR